MCRQHRKFILFQSICYLGLIWGFLLLNGFYGYGTANVQFYRLCLSCWFCTKAIFYEMSVLWKENRCTRTGDLHLKELHEPAGQKYAFHNHNKKYFFLCELRLLTWFLRN